MRKPMAQALSFRLFPVRGPTAPRQASAGWRAGPLTASQRRRGQSRSKQPNRRRRASTPGICCGEALGEVRKRLSKRWCSKPMAKNTPGKSLAPIRGRRIRFSPPSAPALRGAIQRLFTINRFVFAFPCREGPSPLSPPMSNLSNSASSRRTRMGMWIGESRSKRSRPSWSQ